MPDSSRASIDLVQKLVNYRASGETAKKMADI